MDTTHVFNQMLQTRNNNNDNTYAYTRNAMNTAPQAKPPMRFFIGRDSIRATTRISRLNDTVRYYRQFGETDPAVFPLLCEVAVRRIAFLQREKYGDPLVLASRVRRHVASALRTRKVRGGLRVIERGAGPGYLRRHGVLKSVLDAFVGGTAPMWGDDFDHQPPRCDDKVLRREVFATVFCSVMDAASRFFPRPPVGRFEGKPYHERLPLYACSGEIEFSCMTDAATNLRPLHRKGRDFWDVGRDGGGQHEIRFRIAGRLPHLATSCAERVGSVTRMGGHIHLNCAKNEAVGERVYRAFFAHLSWFRALVPKCRRANRFCSVDNTPREFGNALGVKFAAVSANTWNRTGTVEVRLWPSTKSADAWRKRAAFMQSLARWSETEMGPDFPFPSRVRSDTAASMFAYWANWAQKNDRPTLRWVVSQLRAKARRTTRDSFARLMAGQLLPLVPA